MRRPRVRIERMRPDRPPLSPWEILVVAVATISTVGHCAAAHAEPRRRTLATSYTHMTGPNAKWNGVGFACWKAPGGRWVAWGTRGSRYVAMNGNERCVAHRSLPCGTRIRVQLRGQAVTVPVCDRGPYWAVPANCKPRYSQGCWVRGRAMTRLRPGWRYQTDLDLTRLAAHELGLPGRDFVLWSVVP